MDAPGPSSHTDKPSRTRLRQSEEERKAKRRVPEDKRRRIEVSCDRCKTRKTKCIRDADAAACKDCLRAGVQCVSNLPRKRRIYATEEQLAGRYRALDAIVRHLYPDHDLESEEAVERLARELGVHLPESPQPSPLDDGPASSRAGAPASAHHSLDGPGSRIGLPDREGRGIPPHTAYLDIGPVSTSYAAASVPLSFTRTAQDDDGYNSHERHHAHLSVVDRHSNQSPNAQHDSP